MHTKVNSAISIMSYLGHLSLVSSASSKASVFFSTPAAMALIKLLIITIICISSVTGFSLSQSRLSSIRKQPAVHVLNSNAASSSTRLHSTPEDKQAEIEALEAKLRELKGEESAPIESSAINGDVQSAIEEEDDEPEWEILKRQSNDSVMLSERWKEADPSSNSEGGLLKSVGIALGLVVFLGVFSQIPIGNEDLQRYQDYKGSASRIDLGDLNPDVRVQ